MGKRDVFAFINPLSPRLADVGGVSPSTLQPEKFQPLYGSAAVPRYLVTLAQFKKLMLLSYGGILRSTTIVFNEGPGTVEWRLRGRTAGLYSTPLLLGVAGPQVTLDSDTERVFEWLLLEARLVAGANAQVGFTIHGTARAGISDGRIAEGT